MIKESGYEHFEDDKWYTYLGKNMYDAFIGNYLNPDPLSEGVVPNGMDESLEYWAIGVDNIYSDSNYNSIINDDFNEKEKIVNSIEDLSYITEESTKMLDNRLEEIDSSIKTNNLLTMIQTYQTYKINQNTKSLRG